MDRYELYYQYVMSQLLEQGERLKSARATTRNLMTVSVAVLAFAGLIVTNSDTEDFGPILWLCLCAAALFFLCSLLSSLFTLYLGLKYICPHPTELRAHISNLSFKDYALAEWTADGITDAYCLNEQAMGKIAVRSAFAMTFFWLEVISVALFSAILAIR